MLDTIGWSLQTYNSFDGEFDFGKKGRMSERFCYSEGLVYENTPTVRLKLMSWAAAAILDGLAGKC